MIPLNAALNTSANLENSAVATELEKASFHFNPKEGNAKECSNYQTIALISHASEVMFKILQARLWQYVNQELLDVQTGFRRGREARDQTANFHGSVIQLCLTFCDPRDCSPSGSSLHGIFQARILEWVAISYSNIHWDYRKSKKMSENHLLLVH